MHCCGIRQQEPPRIAIAGVSSAPFLASLPPLHHPLTMSDAHSEFGVKKPKKKTATAAATVATPSPPPPEPVATAPPPAEALHPEFGEKKSKSSKGKATEASPAPVTVSVPAAPSPIPDEPSSASKKSVRFDASVSDPVKDASSISLAKSDESEADAEARSASLQAPEYEAHLPRFRFYENDFPEQDEFVVVKVHAIEEMGAYVKLLEYDGIPGLILLSELSRRRIRSIHKLLRVGRVEIVMVIRGDKDRSCIDLSKRRVAASDRVKCEDRYKKACTVQSMLGHISLTLKVPLEDLCRRISFPLYKRFGHAYDAFQLADSDPDRVFEGISISPQERALLLKKIHHSMTPQPLNIRADIDVTCFEYEGIEAVKLALLAGRALSTPETKVTVKILASPTYVLMTTTMNSAEGIALLERVIAAIQTEIKKHKGTVVIRTKPTVTSQQEDVFAPPAAESDEESD